MTEEEKKDDEMLEASGRPMIRILEKPSVPEDFAAFYFG